MSDCFIKKTLFDKPYKYADADVTISRNLLSAIPAFDPNYSGLWKPIFFDGKLYNSSTIHYSYNGKQEPVVLKSILNNNSKIIGIYDSIKINSKNLIKNWESENLNYATHWVPYTGYDASSVLLCWYRYYDINRENDTRIKPGVELYLSDGEYWTISGVNYITDNLKDDAKKIATALSGLNKNYSGVYGSSIYSTGQIDQFSKILSTGPQMDWITEILSTGILYEKQKTYDVTLVGNQIASTVKELEPRNEYGLDKEKLRQMSLKESRNYGKTRYITDKKELVDALSSKYSGYFYIGPNNKASLTSLFEIDNDDIQINLPTFRSVNISKDSYDYINFELQAGSRTVGFKNVYTNLDPNQIKTGVSIFSGLPVYSGIPDPSGFGGGDWVFTTGTVGSGQIGYARQPNGDIDTVTISTKDLYYRSRYDWFLKLGYTDLLKVKTVNNEGTNIENEFRIRSFNPTPGSGFTTYLVAANKPYPEFSSPTEPVNLSPKEFPAHSGLVSIELGDFVGDKLIPNTKKYDVFKLYHNNNDFKFITIPNNRSGEFYDYGLSKIFLHSLGGLRLENKTSTYNFGDETFFDTKYNSTFLTSNIKLIIEKSNSNQLFRIAQGDSFSICQLRNSRNLSCKPFILDNNERCNCKPITYGDPKKLVFTNVNAYVPNTTLLSGIKSYGGLSAEELNVLDIKNLKNHPLPGTTFTDPDLFESENSCSYSMNGRGPFSIDLKTCRGKGKIIINYILASPSTIFTASIEGVSKTSTTQNGSLCFDKFNTGLDTMSISVSNNPSEEFIDKDINTAWGWSSSFISDFAVNEIFYPVLNIQKTDVEIGFFHPNSGWISKTDPRFNNSYLNKSCTIPHRYGNKIKSIGQYFDSNPTGLGPYNLQYSHSYPIYLPTGIQSSGTGLYDTLNNDTGSKISLLAYNNAKLYNNEYLPGLNLLINISGSGYQNSRDILDNSKYFGFVLDNKYRYVISNFNQYQFIKDKCPILENVDFDFQEISQNTGTYPFNDLYIEEVIDGLIPQGESIRVGSKSKNRAFDFFSFLDREFSTANWLKISTPSGPSGIVQLLSVSGNIFHIIGLYSLYKREPGDTSYIGSKIEGVSDSKTSLLVYQNYLTANDSDIAYGKWDQILIDNDIYNYPTGSILWNNALLKTYENIPYERISVSNNIYQSGITYNPYLTWAGCAKIRNYLPNPDERDGRPILEPESLALYYNPSFRLVPSGYKKYLELFGIGHGNKMIHSDNFNEMSYVSGDKIISFQNNINNKDAYFFAGTRTGKIGVAVTLTNLKGRNTLNLNYGGQSYQALTDGSAARLDPDDPYYRRPSRYGTGLIEHPFWGTTGTNPTYIDGSMYSVLYSSGDVTTIKFKLTKSERFPTFGSVNISSNTSNCLSLYSDPLITNIMVFDDEEYNDILSKDAVVYHKHSIGTNNHSQYLDMHIYSKNLANLILDSGSLNFENVLTIKPGSYLDNMKSPYDINKYLIDVRNTESWGVLTNTNEYIDPNKTYTLIKSFKLSECNKRTSEYYGDLCGKGYEYTIEEFMNKLGLNKEDFIIETISFEKDFKNHCCPDQLLQLWFNHMSSLPILPTGGGPYEPPPWYRWTNPDPKQLIDDCISAESGTNDSIRSTFSLGSGSMTDATNVCEPDFVSLYKLNVQGYRFKLDKNKIWTKINKMSLADATSFFAISNNLYEIALDASLGPIAGGGNKYLTDSSLVYNRENCRYTNWGDQYPASIMPLYNDRSNYIKIQGPKGLTQKQQFSNETVFRSSHKYPQKITEPFIDYNKDYYKQNAVLTYGVGISFDKCYEPSLKICSLSVDGDTYDISIETSGINYYININGYKFIYNSLVGLNYGMIVANEPEKQTDQFCDEVIKGTGIQYGKKLEEITDPIIITMPWINTVIGPKFSSPYYTQNQCPSCTSCSAGVSYMTSAVGYKELRPKISPISYLGVSPEQQKITDNAIAEYNNSCFGRPMTEFTSDNIAVVSDIEYDLDFFGSASNGELVSDTVTQHRKAKVDLYHSDINNWPIIKNNTYMSSFWEKNRCLDDNIYNIGVVNAKTRNCCNYSATTLGVSFTITFYHNFYIIDIYSSYTTIPKISRPRNISNTFTCPNVVVSLHPDATISSWVSRVIDSRTIGEIT